MCGGAAALLGMTPALAATGAALAAVVRMLAGDAPAAIVGALIAPLVAVAIYADAAAPTANQALALAAAGWAIVELVRPVSPPSDPADPSDALAISPVIAIIPAAIAGVLDPRFLALVAITGARITTIPRGVWRRPRWLIAIPIAGVLALAALALAATAWPTLGARWLGAPHPIAPRALAVLTADVLGPILSVAALAGLAALARPRYPLVGLTACTAGAIWLDLRTGSLGYATLGLAALLAALATVRLAGMIRIPSGQAITAAMIGGLAISPPAWTAVARRISPPAAIAHADSAAGAPAPAHSGRASR